MNTLNENPDAYAELGYYVRRHVLSVDELAPWVASLEGMIDGLAPGKRMEMLTEPHVHADEKELWLQLCCHPGILDAVEAVLGAEIILLMSHLIVKQPGDGLAVNWHQDNTYWDSVSGTDVGTIWLALEPVDRENACMKVIPGTQKGFNALERSATDGSDLLRSEVEVDDETRSRAVHIELGPGDLSVHDSFIIHGSDVNTSERRRAGFTMRYANGDSTRINTQQLQKNLDVPVFYVRGQKAECPAGYTDARPR